METRGPDYEAVGRKGTQLYDYATDPGELNNLADDPKHRKTLEELRGLVRKNGAKEYRPSAAESAAAP